MMPKHYTIQIQGQLDTHWSDVLNGMTVSHGTRNTPISTLRGELDQAALLGVLYQLHDLNISIISVISNSQLHSLVSQPAVD